MNNLPFDAFQKIYLSKANENDYNRYNGIRSTISNILDRIPSIEDCSSDALESEVNLLDFKKMSRTPNANRVSELLEKFSDECSNDPLFDSLLTIQRFFKMNNDIPDLLQSKKTEIGTYFHEHPQKRSIPTKEFELLISRIMEQFFDEKKLSIVKARKIINEDSQSFFSVIDRQIEIRQKS
jgi:hypothetical protein